MSVNELTRPLLQLAGLVGAAGAAATAFAASPRDAESIIRSGKQLLSQSLTGEPWSTLPALIAASGVLALAFSVAERMHKPPRIRPGDAIRPDDVVGLRAVVKEVGEVVGKLATYPANVVAAWEELIRGAVRVNASDIHVSPTPKGVKITYRVNGQIEEVVSVDSEVLAPLIMRIKVLARLDTTLRTSPQDGRLVMTLPLSDATQALGTKAHNIEARVSTLPTESGERLVLRLVRGVREVPDIPSLGFSPEVERGLLEVLSKPQGLLFVTGPVGSGKTTTLYAALKQISQTRGKTTTMVTLEDPIELELPFATQTQINPKTGMTFVNALRSVLRQDPNVLMVGEIRDRETAEIAIQAGLTGHVILTTVHGQSAAGVFTRMIDMDVEPFVLASATLACLSQRLVRVLCTACRRESIVDENTQNRFREAGIVMPPGPYYEPVGCQFCENQGFAGRMPLTELLVIDDVVRKSVHDRSPTRDIERAATAQGMTTILRDGLYRAQRGETSLFEVLRVAG